MPKDYVKEIIDGLYEIMRKEDSGTLNDDDKQCNFMLMQELLTYLEANPREICRANQLYTRAVDKADLMKDHHKWTLFKK